MTDNAKLRSVLSSIESQVATLQQLLSTVASSPPATFRSASSDSSSPALANCYLHHPVSPLPRFADNGQVHPVDFVTALEDYFSIHHVNPLSRVAIALTQLDGMPNAWGHAFHCTGSDWISFRQSFLSMFWAEVQQDRVIDNMYRSSYDRDTHGSMAAFALHWMAAVKHLSEPIRSHTFVRRLSRMLPSDIEETLLAARVTDEADMLSLLRQLDDAAERRRARGNVDVSRQNTCSVAIQPSPVVSSPTHCYELVQSLIDCGVSTPEPEMAPPLRDTTLLVTDDSEMSVPTPELQMAPPLRDTTPLVTYDSEMSVQTSNIKMVLPLHEVLPAEENDASRDTASITNVNGEGDPANKVDFVRQCFVSAVNDHVRVIFDRGR
jgi:hypothetical protein